MPRPVEPPASWDSRYDVVVIGFGGAGACAAIEAADRGARVLLVDRFAGGGATAMSGGVVYLGGGTEQQRAAGFDDTVEAMRAYLGAEVEDAVSGETLDAFCERSLENASWLAEQGVRFSPAFFSEKTTQPPDGFGLYWSGNEKQRRRLAAPAPRGHVVDGVGMTGSVLFERLASAVARRPEITVHRHTRALSLVVDDEGSVTGVELLGLDQRLVTRAAHRAIHDAIQGLRMLRSKRAAAAQVTLDTFERRWGRRERVFARGGVIVAAGGFIFNQSMLDARAPRFAECMPIGTPGDDGSGVALGEAVGAATAEMERCAASRFIAPPESLLAGVLVDSTGARICDESLYGATLSKYIAERPDGVAYMVIDRALWERARADMEREDRVRDRPLSELLGGQVNHILFRNFSYLSNLHVNRTKAAGLPELEERLGLAPGSLVETVAEYNGSIERGEEDAFGKPDSLRSTLGSPPYYAIGCALDSRLFPGPCLTLGGLSVDGVGARVLRKDGAPIEGLYAAGRSAVGVASRSYVSGLSLADCIFSGRNAGRAAATRSVAGAEAG